MRDIRGTHAILTGASRGIGPYIALELAARGVNLTLAARSAPELEETRRKVEALGVRAFAMTCDVTSRTDLARLVESAQSNLGPIDVLINNAGLEVMAPLTEHSFDQIDGIIRTNVNAPIWLSKLVLPAMLARKSGTIVNVASLAGKVAAPYFTIYCTSKFGLVGFSRALRAELHGSGVSVGAVCPTFVSDAGMWAKFGGKRAPWIAREVTPQQVVAGVLKVIDGAEEVIVNSGPIRPMLALGEAIPGFTAAFMRWVGIAKSQREESARRGAGADRA